jgi:tRNA pseudouridine38-40 synthase
LEWNFNPVSLSPTSEIEKSPEGESERKAEPAPAPGDAASESSTPSRAPFRQCAPDHFRTRIHISYDGTDYCGWQRQTTLTTVQGTLEAALSKIYAKRTVVLGASRTDSGVHAHQQVAHFDAPRDPSAFDLRYAVQCLTPPSVVITEMFQAPPDFHAIASVDHKIYKYRVVNRRIPSALRHRYTHWVRYPLDLDFLNEASAFLVGNQDFKSFQTSGSPTKTTVRNIRSAFWQRLDEDTIEFNIAGDGFLKQMVRNIVGTLIDLNEDSERPERIKEIIAVQDRRKAGPTAPPQGLFLHAVKYPELIDNKCRKL